MKNFAFKLDDINDAVLGRVTETPEGRRNYYTFVGGKVGKLSNRRSPIDLDVYCTPAETLPLNYNDGSLLNLDLGDVVLFNPSGRCTLEYESRSGSNCILLTERCNSKCIMCVQPPRACSDSIDLANALLELIDTPSECIGITGGEPTLAWEGLLQVLHRCREKFPTMEIQLLTNARLLKNYEKCQALAEAGGDRLIVCVPIYCDSHQIHDTIVGAKGAFWESVGGIYNLERFNIPIEIRTVVQKYNYTRLPQWGEFIYRFFPFVSHVAMMALEPIGLAYKNLEAVWVDPVDYSSLMEESIKVLHRGDLKVSVFNHQLCTLPSQLWQFSRRSISDWKNVFFDQCKQCSVRCQCGGFFASSRDKMSRAISSIN